MEITITNQTFTKLFRVKILSVIRTLCPILISFFCICLFLSLSFMIIEGYSVSRMVSKGHAEPIYSVVEN